MRILQSDNTSSLPSLTELRFMHNTPLTAVDVLNNHTYLPHRLAAVLQTIPVTYGWRIFFNVVTDFYLI